jgi:hypothetical protein
LRQHFVRFSTWLRFIGQRRASYRSPA